MELNVDVLGRRAQELAAEFTADYKLSPGVEPGDDGEPITRVKFNKGPKDGEAMALARNSRDHIMLQLYNLRDKAEYDFIVTEMKKFLGSTPMIDFNTRLAKHEARS